MKHTNIFFKLIECKDIPILVLEGGSGSSKTHSILQRIIRRAIKYQGTTTSIVSETLPQLKKGAMKDFFKILEVEKIYDPKQHNKTDNIYSFGTSKVEFFSTDKMANVLGARRDFLFINECIRINWDTAYTLMRYTNVQSIVDFNPAFEFWAHTILRQMENVKWIHSTYRDNPYLPEMQLRLLLQRAKIDENYRKVFVEGEIGNIEGVIFPKVKIVDEFPKDCRWICFGMDFGYTNDPTTLIKVGMRGGELYFDELLYETGLTNLINPKHPEFMSIEKRLRNANLGFYEIIAESSEPKTVVDLRRAGFNIRGAAKGPDSINNGIQLMKQYPMNVTKRSVNMINEFRNYQWQKNEATEKYINVPVDLYNHCIDAARYGCQFKLRRGNNPIL